ETADAAALGRDEGTRAVLLVERTRQRTLPRGEGIPLALQVVELFAECVDLRLGGDNLRLRGLIREVEVRLARVVERRLPLDLLPCCARLVATNPGGIKRVLLPEHLAAHRGQAGRRSVCLAGELGDLEVVLGDERTLEGDLLVEGVERGTCLRSA